MIIKELVKVYVSKNGLRSPALNGFSAQLPDKGLVFILGKSGCGKSTLLNLLGCLDVPDSGSIICGDLDITKMTPEERNVYRANNIGFIFQNFNLFDQLNVYENIIFNMPENTRDLEERADRLMQKLDIAQCKKKKINELSGGQQQRVSIARALIKDCKILLADEPTGNLDEENGRLIFDALKDISKDRLVIVVSHDRESAYAYGDMVIEMNDGVAKQTHCLTQVAEEKTERIMQPDMEKKHQHSSLKTTLKLSVNFMIKKKLRMVFSMLLLAISLGIMGVTSMFYQYDFGAISASVLIDQTDNYLSVVKGFRDPETDKYNMTDMLCLVDEEFIDDLASNL